MWGNKEKIYHNDNIQAFLFLLSFPVTAGFTQMEGL